MSKDALRISAAIALMALVTSAPTLTQTRADSTVSFPPLSTPEQQGMDSHVLAGLFDFIADHSLQIHSLAILRTDHLVLEAYFHPFQADIAHRIASSTKSITSALIGIAIDKGFIREVNQPLLGFFKGLEIGNRNERKENITLEHVLTMSSGFDWPTTRFLEHIGHAWDASGDPVRFVLDRAVKHEPGTRFNYNSGNAHLLSAVIQNTTGMPAAEFARRHLFKPLDISGVSWPSDKNGVSWGGGKVLMKTRDMLKLGYLYLNGGAFAGQQVVSSSWVTASSLPHIQTFYEDHRYGYMWWVHPSGRYRSLGALGQCIYVVPQKKMVVVVTGGLGLSQMEAAPGRLLDLFIIPAVKSNEPLPENRDGSALLSSRIKSVTHPEAEPIPPLPATAPRITNREILLEGKLIGAGSVRLKFDVSSAEIYLHAGQEAMEIGLDGIHRVRDATPFGDPRALVGLKGRWEDDTSFSLHIVFLHGARFDTLWNFSDSGVSIEVEEPFGAYRIRGKFQE